MADGVSSFDPELHRATLKNLAAKFALVVDAATVATGGRRHGDPSTTALGGSA